MTLSAGLTLGHGLVGHRVDGGQVLIRQIPFQAPGLMLGAALRGRVRQLLGQCLQQAVSSITDHQMEVVWG